MSVVDVKGELVSNSLSNIFKGPVPSVGLLLLVGNTSTNLRNNTDDVIMRSLSGIWTR